MKCDRIYPPKPEPFQFKPEVTRYIQNLLDILMRANARVGYNAEYFAAKREAGVYGALRRVLIEIIAEECSREIAENISEFPWGREVTPMDDVLAAINLAYGVQWETQCENVDHPNR